MPARRRGDGRGGGQPRRAGSQRRGLQGDRPAAPGKVLVTGANSGIGLATVLAAARAGFATVGSVRSQAKARQVREAARAAGVDVETVLLDVTDAGACRTVIDRVRPWGLVNNAGYGMTAAIEDVSDEEAHALFETMVFAPLRLARLAIPHMRAAGGGRIVNLSSIYGVTSTPLTGWYQGAKHAVEALSDALRIELARDGLKVILIEPGGFNTGIWDGDSPPAGSRYDDVYRRVARGVQMARPRLGDPAHVARVIVRALESKRPRARYLVGRDAQAIALWDRLTPTPVKDRIVRMATGL